MNGYFRPLTRKIGVVTLTVACVFGFVWMRSLFVRDVFGVGQPDSYRAFASYAGSMRWSKLTPGLGKVGFEWQSETWSRETDFNWNDWNVEWRRECLGFEFGAGTIPGITIMRNERWAIPYWSIVIPLTVLSAYLLFFKSCERSNGSHLQPKSESI